MDGCTDIMIDNTSQLKYTYMYRPIVCWWESRKEGDHKEDNKWEDNIIMGLRDRGWDGMDWTDLAQDSALVNMVNLRVP
jgi:hypothetical protein